MVETSLVPKWPILVPFCGMDHQKSNFSLIFDTLSVGGCWGHPMLIFWKLVDKTQISKPPEPTWHHNSKKLWILLSLRADLLYILQCETPCISYWKMQEKVEIITNHIVHFWAILDKNTQKWILCIGGKFILKNPLQDLAFSLNAVISTNENAIYHTYSPNFSLWKMCIFASSLQIPGHG